MRFARSQESFSNFSETPARTPLTPLTPKSPPGHHGASIAVAEVEKNGNIEKSEEEEKKNHVGPLQAGAGVLKKTMTDLGYSGKSILVEVPTCFCSAWPSIITRWRKCDSPEMSSMLTCKWLSPHDTWRSQKQNRRYTFISVEEHKKCSSVTTRLQKRKICILLGLLCYCNGTELGSGWLEKVFYLPQCRNSHWRSITGDKEEGHTCAVAQLGPHWSPTTFGNDLVSLISFTEWRWVRSNVGNDRIHLKDGLVP